MGTVSGEEADNSQSGYASRRRNSFFCVCTFFPQQFSHPSRIVKVDIQSLQLTVHAGDHLRAGQEYTEEGVSVGRKRGGGGGKERRETAVDSRWSSRQTSSQVVPPSSLDPYGQRPTSYAAHPASHQPHSSEPQPSSSQIRLPHRVHIVERTPTTAPASLALPMSPPDRPSTLLVRFVVYFVF